jgi:rod shape-determining protein MreD
LFSVCLYYALHTGGRFALAVAILAGLAQDALGLTPLGCSSAVFCAVCLLAARFRDLIFIQEGLTHVLLGATGAALVSLILYLLLIQGDYTVVRPSWLLLKLLGRLLLGSVTVPLVFHVLGGLDRRLGTAREGYA